MKYFSISCLYFLTVVTCQAEYLVRVTAVDVIDRLRSNGIPVCFENVLFKKDDAISRDKQIELLKRIPVAERTTREEKSLSSLLKDRNRDTSGSVIVNWKHKQFDFDYPDAPIAPEQVLDALVRADSDYLWRKQVNRFVVFPVKNSFDTPLKGFHASNLVFSAFFKAMNEQIAKPSHLSYILLILGYDWTSNYKSKVYSLNLNSMGSRLALTRFVDTLGSNFVWNVAGGNGNDGARLLQVWPIHKAEQGGAANP